MKRFLTLFFVVLGVIFFLLIIVAVYLFVFDPFNIKPLFTKVTESTSVQAETIDKLGIGSVSNEDTAATDKNPLLSPSQEHALETIGVDPQALPASITPAQKVCFEKILGSGRVAEIQAGDSPTVSEFLKAKTCIE